MTANRPHSEQGIVSLITVTLASILFSIVVVAMVTMVANEQRQASEADLSNRAYFAAESGLEKGILMVKQALAGTTGNSLPTSLTSLEGTCHSDASVGYTCLKLAHVTPGYDGNLWKDGDPYQVDLSSLAGGSNSTFDVEIDWHQPSLDGISYNLPASGVGFSSGAAWSANHYPAILTAQTILFRTSGGTFNPNDPNQLKLVENTIVPSNGAGFTFAESNEAVPHYGTCVPSAASGFACKAVMTITNDGFSRILRLRARYAGTHYAVKLLAADGSTNITATLPDSYESLDVTAKSDNTFRRVRAKVAIRQSSVALDYALFSDTDICHEFLLRDSRSGQGGTNPNGNATNLGSCPF